MRVGVVEDDENMMAATAAGLRRHGFEVLPATTGAEGLRIAGSVDLVLLDLGLPDLDGLAVCKGIREHNDVPIIIVTARGAEGDRVRGLELGADDYVVKPYSMRELVARIRANIRRRAPRTESIVVGPLSLDRERHECRLSGAIMTLTPKEFELLVVLAEEPGRVVPRKEIYARVWDPVWVGSGKSLDVHVTGLRKKLADSVVSIDSVRGVGYRLSLATLEDADAIGAGEPGT